MRYAGGGAFILDVGMLVSDTGRLICATGIVIRRATMLIRRATMPIWGTEASILTCCGIHAAGMTIYNM